MNKKLAASVIIALACFMVLSGLYTIGFFSTINTKLTDNLYGGNIPLDNIVIIAIDDKSIQELGRWPWDRGRFVSLLDKLHDARAVGIDVAFFEPSNAETDKALSDAVQRAGNVVLTAEYTDFVKQDGKLYGKNVLLPVDGMKDAKLGYVNILTDSDGVTRAVNMDVQGIYQSFAENVYSLYLKKNFTTSSRFLINFVGKPGSFKTYSFSDFLKSNIDVKNKIVLVGATSPDLHDDYFVPTSKGKAMPGIEVHANTLQTMLTKKSLYEQSSASVLLILFLLCAVMSLLIYRYRIVIPAISGVVFFFAYIFIAIMMFSKGTIMNLVYPPLALITTYTAVVAYHYRVEEKTKKQLREAFSKYVSPLLVEEILKNPHKLKLGGEKREITILFSDIRGFTTISEALGPEKLVAFLNEYLTEMTNIILKNRGVVDKYIGDAIMAFWGAPLDEKRREYLACKTGVEMMEKLQELRKRWKHLPHIDIGVGLNEGECIVGNMGSHERFDYTAIGDSVNLASRLEGLNKQYGTNAIVSESVFEKAKQDFAFRELDYVKVKGKKKPVKIFELIGKSADAKKKKEIVVFEEGFRNYLAKDFDGAIKEFSKLHDKASHMFIERCHILKKEHLKDWDGAFEHTTK